MTFIPAVVIGAGYAGLAASYYLSKAGIEHVVLERGGLGETWRSQRWDSFSLNTNNRISGFPGEPYAGDNPEGFASRDEVVDRFEQYVAGRQLPVRTRVEVTKLIADQSGGNFSLSVDASGASEAIDCRQVIVASGFQNQPQVPSISKSIGAGVQQLHAADYKSPGLLPPGAILVVGSAQSGCQIVEDLLDDGRRVHVSVSSVGRVPRRYRGRDILDWFIETGFWDVRVENLEDSKMQFTAQPQVSGVGPLGRTISLQQLARRGATLVGRLNTVDGDIAQLGQGVAEAVRFGDERSASFKATVDGHVEKNAISTVSSDPDAPDDPDDGSLGQDAPTQLNLRDANINTLIWCTGFRGAFDWIDAPVFGSDGRPEYERGVTRVPGLYFLGAPWLSKRKSGVFYGMGEDAEYVVQRVVDRL